MKELYIKNSIVCYDDWDIENKPELTAFLKSQDIHHLIEKIGQDIIIVLGWDGSMLNTIWKYHDDGRAFLGLNFWHKWFLLNNREWFDKDASFIVRKYPLLEVSQNGEKKWVWFNDINIFNPDGKAIQLDISRTDIWKINLRWDGVLIATPAWSTWHSKSYRWPIIPHNSDQVIITPKWDIEGAHPQIIDGNGKPLIIKNTGRKFEVKVNIDGNLGVLSKYDEDMCIEIRRIPDKVKLLIAEEHKQDWDNKVTREQGFR